MRSPLRTQAAWASASVTDTCTYTCPCGFTGEGGVTSSATSAAIGSSWFLRSGAAAEAAQNAQAAASAEAWSVLVDAVELAPCPVCDRVDEQALGAVRKRVLTRSALNGALTALPCGFFGLMLTSFTSFVPCVLFVGLGFGGWMFLGYQRVRKRIILSNCVIFPEAY